MNKFETAVKRSDDFAALKLNLTRLLNNLDHILNTRPQYLKSKGCTIEPKIINALAKDEQNIHETLSVAAQDSL